jgi:DNA-binding IclR family transcriptional regulator
VVDAVPKVRCGFSVRSVSKRSGLVKRRSSRFAEVNETITLSPAAMPTPESFRSSVATRAMLRPLATTKLLARDLLRELVGRLNENAYLTSYRTEARSILFETGERGNQPIQYNVPIGGQAPLHAGAAGKAVLAYTTDDSQSLLSLERYTDNTITDPGDLRHELNAIRTRGYATSIGERIPDAAGVAAPYFRNSTIAGSITVSIPRYRFDPPATEAIATAVTTAAATLTTFLSTEKGL